MANTTDPRASRSIAVAICLLVLGACASSGPKLSGMGIGNTRIVKVGNTVELRLPLRDDGNRQWRVSSYDSLYLSVAERPRAERTSSGTWELVVVAPAHTPGETEVEIREIAPRDGVPRIVRFQVRIVD